MTTFEHAGLGPICDIVSFFVNCLYAECSNVTECRSKFLVSLSRTIDVLMPIRVERESIKLLIICVIGHDTEELPGFLGGVVRIQCAAFLSSASTGEGWEQA